MRKKALRGAPPGLWSRGMLATLIAQFLSALADNALLFAALALVKQDGFPAWSGPLLQEFFVVTYILLAPFVGIFADSRPKAQVMLLANLMKVAGTLAMCLGCNPFLSYALVGTGAAAYSPAKYGILGELTAPEHLVKANGLLEASTISAIVLGAILGGALADWSVEGAMILITAGYGAAALSTLLIPRLQQSDNHEAFSFLGSISTFASQTKSLWKSGAARLALIGTSMFWGAGAALRFMVIAWVPVALRVTNNRLPGFMTGMVAFGIIIGAALAARFVKLSTVNRALPAGILIGVGVCVLPLANTLPFAYSVMAFVGVSSGFFVVPLDALLQREGERSVGVGASIAIQNLCENLCMLLLVSAYTLTSFARLPINGVAIGFGIFIAGSLSALTLWRNKSAR